MAAAPAWHAAGAAAQAQTPLAREASPARPQPLTARFYRFPGAT